MASVVEQHSDAVTPAAEALGVRVRNLLHVVLDAVPADLVDTSIQLLRLLHAADTFPRGGLYSGHYAQQAALRYELMWLPLLARCTCSGDMLVRPKKGRQVAGASDDDYDDDFVGGRPALKGSRALVPPLDVALVWLHHRLMPEAYTRDCTAIVGKVVEPATSLHAFCFSGFASYKACETAEQRDAWATRLAWDRMFRALAPYWPPGAPGTAHDLTSQPPTKRQSQAQQQQAAVAPAEAAAAQQQQQQQQAGGCAEGQEPQQHVAGLPAGTAPGAGTAQAQAARGSGGGAGDDSGSGRGALARSLVRRMPLLCPLLHSILRPAYLDPSLLGQAVERYCRFLLLHSLYPDVPLMPTADIALMWVTHMAVPQHYRATCVLLFGHEFAPAKGALQLACEGHEYAETCRLYELHFGEVFDPPITRPVPLASPHPLLSSPLAPLLAYYELRDTNSATSEGESQLRGELTRVASRLQLAVAGAGGSAVIQPLGHVTPSSPTGQPALVPRCGAHALYLAYLLRRGMTRRGRKLLGAMLGAAHRRRAAVRYMARKAERFPDLKHLPHSDSHPYILKLRPRPLGPDAAASGDQLQALLAEASSDEGEGDRQQVVEGAGGEVQEWVARSSVGAASADGRPSGGTVMDGRVSGSTVTADARTSAVNSAHAVADGRPSDGQLRAAAGAGGARSHRQRQAGSTAGNDRAHSAGKGVGKERRGSSSNVQLPSELLTIIPLATLAAGRAAAHAARHPPERHAPEAHTPPQAEEAQEAQGQEVEDGGEALFSVRVRPPPPLDLAAVPPTRDELAALSSAALTPYGSLPQALSLERVAGDEADTWAFGNPVYDYERGGSGVAQRGATSTGFTSAVSTPMVAGNAADGDADEVVVLAPVAKLPPPVVPPPLMPVPVILSPVLAKPPPLPMPSDPSQVKLRPVGRRSGGGNGGAEGEDGGGAEALSRAHSGSFFDAEEATAAEDADGLDALPQRQAELPGTADRLSRPTPMAPTMLAATGAGDESTDTAGAAASVVQDAATVPAAGVQAAAPLPPRPKLKISPIKMLQRLGPGQHGAFGSLHPRKNSVAALRTASAASSFRSAGSASAASSGAQERVPGQRLARTSSASSGDRPSGSYTPTDSAYMASLGKVASLVTEGDASQGFQSTLRQRHGGASPSAAGSGNVGAAWKR